jgi:hypothetical protein
MEDTNTVNELRETIRRYGIETSLSEEVTSVEGQPIDVTSIVPDYYDMRGIEPTFLNQIRTRVVNSDCVLVMISRNGTRSEIVNWEIGIAEGLGKTIIPIIEQGAEIPETLRGKQYIIVDRNQPRLSYDRAAQYLNRLKIEKESRNAIGGLLLLGIGLFLLAAIASSD